MHYSTPCKQKQRTLKQDSEAGRSGRIIGSASWCSRQPVDIFVHVVAQLVDIFIHVVADKLDYSSAHFLRTNIPCYTTKTTMRSRKAALLGGKFLKSFQAGGSDLEDIETYITADVATKHRVSKFYSSLWPIAAMWSSVSKHSSCQHSDQEALSLLCWRSFDLSKYGSYSSSLKR